MLSNNLRSFLIISLIFFTHTHMAYSSAIVSGDGLDQDQRVSMIEMLSTYEGTKPLKFAQEPSLVNDPVYSRLFEGHFSERLSFLSETFERQHAVKPRMIIVPQTVWDIFVICKFVEMTSASIGTFDRYNLTNNISKELFLPYKQEVSENKLTSKAVQLKVCTGVYFDFSSELVSQIDMEGLTLEKLGEYLSGKIDALKKFLSHENLKGRIFELIIKDIIQDWHSKDSILKQALSIEWQAMNNNCIPLFRSTVIRHLGAGIKGNASTSDQILQALKNNTVLLDVPFYVDTDLSNKVDTREYLDRFCQFLKNPPFYFGDDGNAWSFSSSVLSGIIYDGYNKPKSASTFVFHTKENIPAPRRDNLLYAVSIPKREVIGTLYPLVYSNSGSIPALEIFSSGEQFHPRLKIPPTYPGHWTGELPLNKEEALKSCDNGLSVTLMVSMCPELFDLCQKSKRASLYNLKAAQIVIDLLVKYGFPIAINGISANEASVALFKAYYINLAEATEVEFRKMIEAPTSAEENL